MAETAQAADVEGNMHPGLAMAALPYAVLTVVAILVLVVPPIKSALAQFEIGLPFPQVQTGYGVVREGEDPYLPFSPLTHPGTFLLVASLVGWVVYRARGYYAQYQEGLGERPKDSGPTAGDAVPSWCLDRLPGDEQAHGSLGPDPPTGPRHQGGGSAHYTPSLPTGSGSWEPS